MPDNLAPLTAKDLAGGTTELNTALGILADSGIKGSEGGTHLRNVLLYAKSIPPAAAKFNTDGKTSDAVAASYPASAR